MHIAFLTTEYPPLPSGGIGTSIRNLSRALVRQGHRVSVVGWGQDAAFEDAGVRVRFSNRTSIPKTAWFTGRRQARHTLRTLIERERLDIVEAHDWCGVSAGIEIGCPMVVRCNGTATYFAHMLHGRVRPLVFGAEWLALRRADSVVAVSRFTAALTKELFGLNGPVGTIPNGIDLSLFAAAPYDVVEPGAILYLGTMQRKKGVLDVCRIFSRVAERCAHAALRLVGRDCRDPDTGSPSTWALCERALSDAARRRTDYLGVQSYEHVRGYVRQAAVCLFPSYAEALPLSWLEAMACARPVVAYDIGWAPEVITTGMNGVLVPAGDIEGCADACVSLLEDQDRAGQIGLAARRTVENAFTDEIAARQSVCWYEQVLRDYQRRWPLEADDHVTSPSHLR